MFDIEGLKKKIYVAVVGMPDCGKSTFIKNIVQFITKRTVNVDSFCDEQQLDMTIRSAQIFFRDKSIPYDIVFLDCPGHIFEYEAEAKSVLSKAHFIIKIINKEQNKVIPFNDLYKDEKKWNNQLEKLMQKNTEIIYLHSHSKNENIFHYDINNINNKFLDIFDILIQHIKNKEYKPVNPIETAIRIVKLTCENIKDKKVAMCSFGKDSILMLQIFKLANCLDKIKIEYPNSGFDLPGISDNFKKYVEKFFNCNIESFNVIEAGWNFENHSVQEMMLCKAKMLNNRINNKNYKVCFTGIRRDEEGTRAKEKFFSPRNKDGSFDYLIPQEEIFNNELDLSIIEKYPHIRVNPLLDLCEADIWYATKYFNLPVCSEYFSNNGYRYRSLGDQPITTPLKSDAKTIEEICKEVDESLIPERACRAKQDKSVKFGMEKLRKAGFF